MGLPHCLTCHVSRLFQGMPKGDSKRTNHLKEMYLFANDGENHTNNVKQLENMKKAMEENFQPPRLGPRGDAEDP